MNTTIATTAITAITATTAATKWQRAGPQVATAYALLVLIASRVAVALGSCKFSSRQAVASSKQ